MNGEKVDLNRVILNADDEYSVYFKSLCYVFERLKMCYESKAESGDYESKVIMFFLQKLLYTVEVLRWKCLYNRAHSLKVDMHLSGFPNYYEINNLTTDFALRDKVLREIPPSSILKNEILDLLFQTKKDPIDKLSKLGYRTYLKMLDMEKMFTDFVCGELKLLSENDQVRNYVFSWACYDFTTNCPYIHILNFEQDAHRTPLSERGNNYDTLLEVIKSEGSRVADIGILAFAIDDRLENIHPKILKRICIGPLYSKFLMDNITKNMSDLDSVDENYKSLNELFSKYGEEKDFILFFTDEIIFSKRQDVSQKGLFGLGSKVREIFHIPEDDPECYAKRASVIFPHILLPHDLLQHMISDKDYQPDSFDRCGKITYNKEGVNHHGK